MVEMTHAPIDMPQGNKKEQFRNSLQDTREQIQRKEEIILTKDMNAQVEIQKNSSNQLIPWLMEPRGSISQQSSRYQRTNTEAGRDHFDERHECTSWNPEKQQ